LHEDLVLFEVVSFIDYLYEVLEAELGRHAEVRKEVVLADHL
jgi:hypothetical protein